MLQKLLLALDECAWAYNLNLNKYVFVSPAVYSILGVTSADFDKDNELWIKITVPDDQPIIIEVTNSLKKDEWAELTYRVNVNGQVKWVHEKKLLFTDDNLGHDIIIGVIKDVSDPKEVNFHLNKSLGDFSILFEKNPNPMWIYEIPSLRILKVNEAAIDLYGYSKEEFLTFTIRDIRPKIDLAKFNDYIFRRGITKGILHGYNNSGIWRHINKHGDTIYAEITGHEIQYHNTSCRIVVASNVTERVHFEEEVKKRENFLRSLIESQTNFLTRCDAEGYFTYVNTSFLKAFGFANDEEVLSRHFCFTAISEDEHLVDNAIGSCMLEPGKVVNLVYRNLDGSGMIRWSEWEMIGLADEKGEITDIQAVGHDITDSINASNNIDAQNRNLRRIASLSSHELRGPVATLLGLVSLFDEKNLENPGNLEIITHLKTISVDLDKVIREIVLKTFISDMEP